MDPEIIREIQEALRAIAFNDPRHKLVSVDGIFGPATKEAVSIYQSLRSIPINGEVSPQLFDRLTREANGILSRPVSQLSVLLHPDETIRPLEHSDRIPFIKQIINVLSKIYSNIPPVSDSDIYDEETVSVIRKIQQLHDLEQNGNIDRQTWNVLVDLFNNRPIDAFVR